MAEKLYGGAYLSSFVDAILDNLSKILEDDSVLNGNYSAMEFLPRLEECLLDVAPVLDDAELKQFTDKRVKRWLADLQDALYFADDFLDELSTKAATATQTDSGISASCSRVVDSYIEDTGDMERIVGRLESVIARKKLLRLKETAKVDMSWKIPSTSLVEPSEICGRKEDKEAILKLLMDDHDADLSVIPIVGMGGIGKTTLAQMLYHDDKVKKKFDFRGWVCVSEEFDVVKVTKTIIEAITSSSCNLTDLNLLQHDLKEKLSRKKFFVVLDDVWNENYDDWNMLLKPFQKGVKGSKILITTRSKKVASLVETVSPHELRSLSDEDCWLVFSKHARLSTTSMENPTLIKIGKDIIKKCDGLPLAAQALGGLLRGNSDVKYWNHLLKSEIWGLSDDGIKGINVAPALRISYYFLPSYLKQCFVYCSLYPKDYEFSKDELILLWMAENFLQPKGKKTMEEVGNEYFDELIARSFFQPHSTRQKIFVMHDLVHDLAMIFAGEFYYRAEDLEKADEIDSKTHHLSHNATGNYPISKLLAVCDRVKDTRTFLEINLKQWIPFNMENAPCILLSKLLHLRALSFTSFPLESLPDSIGGLIHLRYLDLSETYIVTLPESLGELYNLQTLKLVRCSNLKMLPVGMKDLVNLRHLDIRGTNLHEMPKGMNKLKKLQFLSDYVVGKNEENKIKELGALADLRKSIHIANLENVVNSSEALDARMSDKDGIDSMTLSWWNEDENVVDSQVEEDILDKLRPHHNLKELEIIGYRGTRFPDWLGHSTYNNITEIRLFGCRNCCTLPSLGQLPSLKYLKISDFEMLGTVGAEFYQKEESCVEKPFPKLETLEFKSMNCWKEWCPMKLNSFPRLKQLIIRKCPMLRGELPNYLPSLESLEIENCEQLSCSLPRAPAMTLLGIEGANEVRIGELPPLLRDLSIGGNHQVEWVVEAITHKQLTCLTFLSISDCSSNISFPVSAIPPSLENLRIIRCRKLELQMDGQHHSLQALSITESCDSVTSFSLLDAFPNLMRVEIWNCEKMESIVVSGSLSCLRSLWINHCGSLKSMSKVWMAAPQLDILEIGRCPEIDLSATGDPNCSLRCLLISYYEKLASSAPFMNSQFHGLTHLHIFGEDESVKCLPKEGWLPASLEHLSLSGFKSVETLDCKEFTHLTSLQTLGIYECPKLENIDGEKLPASLIRLSISDTPLLGKRCEMKDPQIWPKISHIQGIEVDRRWIW
ncbi:hypothetical protein PIB30_048316 [Stylosanthes scabra]|uniref:Disease resistance RPP13-like protein 1 n=1 Tax=Stylosanthes scabra TaxID=79078 RepID=A0ABU6YF86_9FABA|nr:hypothetical protein [Stylosanthes scabra]